MKEKIYTPLTVESAVDARYIAYYTAPFSDWSEGFKSNANINADVLIHMIIFIFINIFGITTL